MNLALRRAAACLLIVVALTIAVASAHPLLAESSGWQWSIPRHTLGFPNSINTTIIKELLQQLKVSVSTSTNAPSTESVKQVAYAISAKLGVAPSTIENVLNSINNAEVRSELINLLKAYASNRVSIQQVLNALKALANAYVSGTINPQAYSAALDLIRRISSSAGLNINELYQSVVKNLNIPKYIGSALGNIPHVPLPSAPQMPALPQASINSVLLVVAIAIATIFSVAALVTVLRRAGISTRIRVARISRFVEAHFGKPVIREYWKAVAAIEARLHTKKLDTETHWEFFHRISAELGEVLEAFRKLTLLYELCRFGGVEDESMVREARTCAEVIRRWSASI